MMVLAIGSAGISGWVAAAGVTASGVEIVLAVIDGSGSVGLTFVGVVITSSVWLLRKP